MRLGNKKLGARLRLVLGTGIAFGPGKADLLQGIRETGSISAAGRGMNMSYTRAWHLVEQMNHQFRSPLVSSTKGGARRGGAALTDLGEEVLALYRRMERDSARAVASDLRAMRRMLA